MADGKGRAWLCATERSPILRLGAGERGGSQWKGVRRLTMETTRAESHVDVHVDVWRSAMGGGQRRRQQPAARGATMRACESRGQSWGVAWRQSRASMRRVGRRERRRRHERRVRQAAVVEEAGAWADETIIWRDGVDEVWVQVSGRWPCPSSQSRGRAVRPERG